MHRIIPGRRRQHPAGLAGNGWASREHPYRDKMRRRFQCQNAQMETIDTILFLKYLLFLMITKISVLELVFFDLEKGGTQKQLK